MKAVLITAAVAVLVGVEAAPAQKLTLDDCLDLALKNRASIIAARGAEDLAKAGQRAALGAFLPRLDAQYSYSKTRRREIESEFSIPTAADTVVDSALIQGTWFKWFDVIPRDFHKVMVPLPDQDYTGKSLDLSANMSLLDVTNWFGYAEATANSARAHLDVIASEQDLILSVKVAYYAHLAALENVDVQRQAVKRSDEQLKLIESKFDLGSAAKSDVLKQRVQVGNDKLTLLSAENAVTTSRADLAYTIGLDPASEVEFATDYTPRETVATLEECISYGLEHQPGLLAAHEQTRAAKQGLRGARAGYLPTLGAYGSLSWSDGTQGDTALYDFSSRSLVYGLAIRWSIFDGFLRERQVTAAKVDRNNAMAQLADMRNAVVRGIKTARLDIDKTGAQRDVAQDNVTAATEDLKITQEKYDLGAAAILDLLDAQVSLKEAQVALIRAGFDHNLAIARLENAMGKM